MRNKKWIAAALVCGFVLGNSMPAAQAGTPARSPAKARRKTAFDHRKQSGKLFRKARSK